MSLRRDTICALASGSPPSAISVIRISGPAVTEIVAARFSKAALKPRHATLVDLVSETGDKVDEGLAIFMPGPASYTGEDTVELSLHGGRIITELALKSIMSAGARLAESGEFTRRAFEAGKLDLTRAEAVADLIDAESEAQHDQALKQMHGALETLYSTWREDLTECLALLEASIDFPDEEDAPDRVDGPVSQKLAALQIDLQKALAEGNITERIRDGFKIAILGKPNAGKSTLLNQLAKREAAIVTDIPGAGNKLPVVYGSWKQLQAIVGRARRTTDEAGTEHMPLIEGVAFPRSHGLLQRRGRRHRKIQRVRFSATHQAIAVIHLHPTVTKVLNGQRSVQGRR